MRALLPAQWMELMAVAPGRQRLWALPCPGQAEAGPAGAILARPFQWHSDQLFFSDAQTRACHILGFWCALQWSHCAALQAMLHPGRRFVTVNYSHSDAWGLPCFDFFFLRRFPALLLSLRRLRSRLPGEAVASFFLFFLHGMQRHA